MIISGIFIAVRQCSSSDSRAPSTLLAGRQWEASVGSEYKNISGARNLLKRLVLIVKNCIRNLLFETRSIGEQLLVVSK